MNIQEVIKYDESGNVDVTASTAKIDETLATLRTQLIDKVGTFAGDQDAIKGALDKVFSKYERLNMPACASFALAELPAGVVTPANHGELTERVLDYVRANSGEGKLFTSTKGPRGGVTKNAK